MGKEKKSKHGKTISEIMEMKKKKENSTKMNQSNNFEDSSNPVSPTRPQVRTMGEIMEMKKKWDSTVQSQHCSSSPSKHQTYHSPSRPQTCSQLHLASSSQVQHSPSRPQTRSQQQLQFSPSRPGIRSQQQLHSSPSRPGTRSEQQLHSFPSKPRTRSQQCTQNSPTTQNEMPSTTNTSTGLVPDDGDDGTKKGPMIVKKGRGCAQFPKGWGTGKKLEVTLDSKGRVIGPDVNHYKTAIECIARIGVKLPLNYVEFNHIPEYLRVMAWEEVEHNTFLPPEAKSVVLADLKDIWRRWKHEIKVKYFLPHIDDLEFLSQSPTERVEQDQWKELVTYWKDEDAQKIARKNAINVSKKQCLHRTGRTSFAILKQEMMMKGTDPSTLDVWLESRSRGKGFEDDDTLDLHTHFTRELSKKPELERDKDFKEQIFKNAMGEERYKRLSQVKIGKRTFENVIASMSCVQEIEELKMLKHGLIEEREKMKQIQDEFNHEKEKLRLEKEKVTSLGEKLELLISQLPTISSMLTIQTQVPGASSLRQETLSALKDVSSSKEQEVVGERSRKEKFIADYSKAFNVGAKVHLFCHQIPKKIIAEGVVVGTIGQEGVPSGFVRVYVKKAHIPQEKLQRPSKGVTTIGEAVNQCVYWEFVNVMEI